MVIKLYINLIINHYLIELLKNFEKLDIEIVLNVNSDEKQFKKTGLTLIKDEFVNFQGPLAGIYSAMNWALKNKKRY